MFMETESLRTRLKQLRQTGFRLADLLTLDADRLDAEGWPPARMVSDDLRGFRDQLGSLTSQFRAVFDEQGPFQFQSLNELETELDRRDLAKRATAIARKIVQIQSPEGQTPDGLEKLQSAATEMIASQGLHESREQIRSFAAGTHAWCDLLRMIGEGGTLPDSEWTLLNTSIETAFGRTLAVAAARGRLVLPPHVDPESVPEPVFVVTLPTSSEPIVAERTFEIAAPTPVVPTLPDIEPVAPALEEVSLSLRPGTRSSVLERAVAKAKSESTAIRHISLDVAETISEVAPTPVAQIDESVSSEVATESSIGPIDSPHGLHVNPQLSVDVTVECSHSVFDDIEPLSRPRPLAPPVTTSPRPAPVPPPVSRTPVPSVASSSIFDDDDSDELVRFGAAVPLAFQIRETPTATTQLPSGPSPLAERLLAQARFTDATGASASLAATILNGPDSDRVDLIPDLIFHLIHEGRPGLAYHLSRSLESRSAVPRPFVPSWLIRTWTYGHALVFPKGQLAGLLQDDLQTRATTELRTGSPNWNLALSFLVRAATLRPAIIAPASRAASVLRGFELQQDCVQLYNYCSRIGAAGERIQGVFPGLFKQTTASAPYSDQLSTLRVDITTWKDSIETVAMKYQITSQLFQKTGWSLRAGLSQRHPEAAFDWMNWQIALRLGESLVGPVMEDRRSELSRVKSIVEDVSTKLAADESSDGRRQLSQPEIRAYLRQATTFAQRWIGLHSGAATNAAQNYLPQAAVELRSDIQNRHAAVMGELHTLATEQSTFEVRMAVACLMLSVQELHDLVDPNLPTDTREADPRHLLHSELLKIPNLRLSFNWEPEIDLHSLESEILEFLSQPQPDWSTAFQMHLAQGSHQMAERILSLAIWTNEEREALQGVLDADRGRQRSDFAQELQEVQKMLMESVHLDILQETERAGIETRLLRLHRIHASDSDISSGILELDRVRESLVKRREREAERIRSRLRRLSGAADDERGTPPIGGLSPGASPLRGWVMDFDQSSS